MRPASVSAAALLALAHRAAAAGAANVKNMCSYPVYLVSVSEQAGNMETLSANGGTWSQPWQINGDGGGLSIKMSREPNLSSITQFEYTLADGLWYDISNINGYPFEGFGLSVQPSESGCRSIICPSTGVCSSAYNQPDDNEATAFCGAGSSMDIVLCSDNSGGESSSPAPSPPSPSPETSSEPSSEPEAAPETPPPAPPASSAEPTPTVTQPPSSPVAVATTVEVHTTLVTQIVTMEIGSDGNAMFEIAKRDAAHAHDHRNAHRGNHARHHRHAAEQDD